MSERYSRFSIALAFLLSVFVAAGCGGGEQAEQAEEGAAADAGTPAQTAVVDQATAATVSGSVMFTGTAPEAESIDMSDEATCAEKYSTPKMTESVVVNGNGTLRNVFVYVKEGLGEMTFPVPTEPAVLDQAGCWYTPRVFGLQVGQDLLIKNSDGLLHNINAKATANRGFNISQPVVMETKRSFRTPEVMVRFECDVHGWMFAYAGVLTHPYYAVTGADGSFTLEPLPPGTYTIEAWHEVYGTQTQQITVGANESAEVSFTFAQPAA